jgi:tetratricopeptide (TPR) repeat protein
LQAECRRAQGAKAAAEKLVDEALRLEPKHLNAWYLKGQLALEAGQAAAAVEALRKAVECDSKHWRSRYALGMAYRRLGDVRRSAEELKATEELRKLWDRFAALHTQAIKDANNADLRYELGQTAQRLDKTELAVSWFQAALALDPEHKQAQAALQALTR